MTIITDMLTDTALLRLLQLASPMLPVGAYAYSQGLEYAIEAEWIRSGEEVQEWISGLLSNSLAKTDLPALARLHMAWSGRDEALVRYWNARLYALRETAELRAEDHHLGSSLAHVLFDLGMAEAGDWRKLHPACFATLFALASVKWRIAPREAMLAYAWAWVENQVAAAIKLVPLGQATGQRLLSDLQPSLISAVDAGMTTNDDIGRSLPGLAMASMKHARMYSRLFRS